jgi:hypothetical protein
MMTLSFADVTSLVRATSQYGTRIERDQLETR